MLLRAIENQAHVFAPAQVRIGPAKENRLAFGHASVVDPWRKGWRMLAVPKT